MKLTSSFAPTRKEAPRDAEIPSHKMMLRAGLIRQHAAGVYALMPMGWRVIRKVMDIVRSEMDAIGCQEFYLPCLTPAELWQTSGRWDTFGPDMFRLRDRKNRELCLAPTHEEVFTEIAAAELHSYRDLPRMWYQIQTKFRDEVRPRSGLLRVRQFFMKDAYSFSADAAGLDACYGLQRAAYLRIFARAGLDVVVVKASSGAMGGRDCEEFMVLSESGDDQIVHCPACGYAANQEVAESKVGPVSGDTCPAAEVPTPGKRTIAEVAQYLDVAPAILVKSLVYKTKQGFAFVLVRGDHEVDDGKLAIALGDCRPAEPEEVRTLTGADVGFVSPIGMKGVRVFADPILEGGAGLVAGANKNDHHITGVVIGRDITVDSYVPLRAVRPGEPCPVCAAPLDVARAIEVGHIFKLGTRYSEALGANVLDENGDSRPIVMGSYGIGIERIMACAIERYFDGNAMVWPRSLAPYRVEILPLNVTSEPVSAAAGTIYDALVAAGVDVFMDDRDERAGVKFKDADLYGAPMVVVIGDRTLAEGLVEIRMRDTGVVEKKSPDAVVTMILEELGCVRG